MVDLPAPDRPVNHSTAGFWFFSAACASRRDVERLPMDVLRAAQREVQHARRDRGVGQLVDQDEAAERRGLSRRARTRAAGRSRGCATPIALSSSVLAARCSMRVDVDLVFRRAGPSRVTVCVPSFSQ